MSLTKALIIGSIVGVLFAGANVMFLGIPGMRVGSQFFPFVWNHFTDPQCGESCWGADTFLGSAILFLFCVFLFALVAALTHLLKNIRR